MWNLFPFNFHGSALNTPGIRKIDLISLYFSVVSRHLSVHKFWNMNHLPSMYLSLWYSIHVPGVSVSRFLFFFCYQHSLCVKMEMLEFWSCSSTHVDIRSQASAAGKLVMCACLSISSNCTHKNISGAQAGKENLALAQCCVSLKKIIVPKTRKLQQVLI